MNLSLISLIVEQPKNLGGKREMFCSLAAQIRRPVQAATETTCGHITGHNWWQAGGSFSHQRGSHSHTRAPGAKPLPRRMPLELPQWLSALPGLLWGLGLLILLFSVIKTSTRKTWKYRKYKEKYISQKPPPFQKIIF